MEQTTELESVRQKLMETTEERDALKQENAHLKHQIEQLLKPAKLAMDQSFCDGNENSV